MSESVTERADFARLIAIRDAVRRMAWDDVRFAERLRVGFVDFAELVRRVESKKADVEQRKRAILHTLVSRGLLRAERVDGERHRLTDDIRCPIPDSVAQRWERLVRFGRALLKSEPDDQCPEKARKHKQRVARHHERQAANDKVCAALVREELEWRDRYESGLPDDQARLAEQRRNRASAKGWSFLEFHVSAARPNEFPDDPPSPYTIEAAELARFAPPDYLTIALYRLGELADAGLARKFITREDADKLGRFGFVWWSVRFPTHDADVDTDTLAPSAVLTQCPIGVYEEMWRQVKGWFSNMCDQSRCGEMPIAAPPLVGALHVPSDYVGEARSLARALNAPPESVSAEDWLKVKHWLRSIVDCAVAVVPTEKWPAIKTKDQPSDLHKPIPTLPDALRFLSRLRAAVFERVSLSGLDAYLNGAAKDHADGPQLEHGSLRCPLAVLITNSVRAGNVVLDHFGQVRGVSKVEMQSGESNDDTPKKVLGRLKAHDRQAWQLATLHRMTQDKVALALNKEHGTTYTQGQVSRMIARAKAHADANGLTEKVAGSIVRPRTVDPGRLELGARVDKRKPRPSDMTRVNDDDQ